jgi:hypothetical protein
VDGKQRIEAIRAFRAAQVGIPGDWLDARELAVGTPGSGWVGYLDLAPGAQRRLFDTRVAVYVSHLPTVDDEAELYSRVNYAGTPPPAQAATPAFAASATQSAPPAPPAAPAPAAPAPAAPAPPPVDDEIRWQPGVR